MNPSLYIIATPIGNLKDISFRAVETLNQVDLIAAEDTRTSARLLDHYGIRTPMISCHDHNEKKVAVDLVSKMKQGIKVGLISDAGTPLISDPGFDLVSMVLEAGLEVSCVPGASSVLAALSVSGLPSSGFSYCGFPPARKNQRIKFFEKSVDTSQTLVFLEVPHRIKEALRDMSEVFGGERPVCIARELTKKFEQITHCSLGEALIRVENKDIPEKGEFVVVLAGNRGLVDDESYKSAYMLLELLLEDLSPARAATLVSRFSGVPRSGLYKKALQKKDRA